jgi:hypothetical protein
MALSSTSLSSIELVKPEIENTIQQAEKSLERFQENRDSGEDLQNCLDCLNQLRGIFVLVEVHGCVLLCQESVNLANEVPVGASNDKNSLLTNLSNAIFILRRYTEYFCQYKVDYPELLLPIINELRVARKSKPYPESHFFDLTPNQDFDSTTLLDQSDQKKLADFTHHAKRFRHMYQVGLLDLLREKNTQISLRLISRASRGCVRLSYGEAMAEFWALVAILADVCLSESITINDPRKRLFMKIEKHLREMALIGEEVTTKSAPDSIRKDLLYLIALSGSKSERIQKLLDGFNIAPFDFTELDLQRESRRLFGPGADVLKSLSSALQEELIQLKDKLDILERHGEPQTEDISFIAAVFERLSSTLSMLDLPKISLVCDQQVKRVSQWVAQEKDVTEAELMQVADVVLNIEQAIKCFEETGIQADIDTNYQTGSEQGPFLIEAILVVIEESKLGLSLIKRSISSYIDSQGDKLHLANVSQVLAGIKGAMAMIQQERASSLLGSCITCIKEELIENEALPDSKFLETLADALTSLEYFIESMNVKGSVNEALLKLTEESLASIGYHS